MTTEQPGLLEQVVHDGIVLMYIVHAHTAPDQTMFLTPPEFNLQLGFIVHEKGHEIPRHVHLPIERHTVGSQEVIVVQRGSCDVDVYTDDRQIVSTHRVTQGDVLIAVNGGHGFHMVEDTVLLEVKQGPYPGVAEKERF